MRLNRLASWVAAVSTAVACGGGGVATPAFLVVSSNPYDPDFLDTVTLAWQPTGGVDRYELQARVGSDPWETVDDQIPGDSDGGYLSFDAAAPEAADYYFRLRSIKGTDTSAWSNEAHLFRGVRPARDVRVSSVYDGVVIGLSWTQGSTQAQTLLLERAVIAWDGGQGAWSPVPGVDVADTSLLDADIASWVDGAQFTYRLTYWKNGHSSAPATGTSVRHQPLAPIGLTAVPAGPNSIQLTWTPRSTYANRQVVVRFARDFLGPSNPGDGDVVELPITASSYLDVVPSRSAYFYAVRAQVSQNLGDFALSDYALGFSALDPAVPFSVAGLAMPLLSGASTDSVQVARDSAGHFGLVEHWDYGIARAHLWQGTSWSTHDAPEDAGLITPAILFDPQDRPHLFTKVFREGVGYLPHHEWLTPTGWQGEIFSTGMVHDVTIDATGAVHGVSCEGDIRYLTNAGGSWTSETLPAQVQPSMCRISVGPGGDPRIAYGTWDDLPTGQVFRLSWVRREGNEWIHEPVPGTVGVDLFYDKFFRVLAPTATSAAIVYERRDSYFNSTLYAVVRDDGVWGAVEEVGLRPYNGTAIRFAAAASLSGRLLVAWNGTRYQSSGAPGVAALREPGGSWNLFTLFDNGAGVACGFTPAGKGWVLDGLSGPNRSGPSHLLYEER
jgi:hypothetical protein